MDKDISFIVPAYNEEGLIEETIRLIFAYMPNQFSFEVLVIDHGSTDKTAKLALSAGAKVISGSEMKTIAALRNEGVRNSLGHLLFFIDADISLTKEWFEHISRVIVDLFENKKQVSGSVPLIPDNSSMFMKSWFYPKTKELNPTYLGSGHMLMNRSLFDDLGGFDVSMETSEDLNFCLRAKSIGAEISPNSRLKVLHRGAPLTIFKFIKRESWHGKGDLTNIRSFISSKVALVTCLFLSTHVIFFSLKVIGLNHSLSLLVIFIASLCLSCSFLKFKREGWKSIFINSITFYFYFIGRSLAILSLVYRKRSYKRSRQDSV